MQTADLEAIPLFAGLSPTDLARVASVTRPLQLAVGEVVVNEGEFAFSFYAIKHGAAEVHRGGECVAALGDGDVFGEIGVVPSDAGPWTRRRGASVIVTAPTEAIAIDGGDLRRLTQDIPGLGEAIRATAAARSGGRSTDLRTAIIGYGLAGRFFHAPLIAATEGLALATVVTSSPERRAQVSREHPGAQVLGSAGELWAAASDHDLVVIATPNRAHAPLAGEAIDRRLPVVVDKPLAMTSAEAAELIGRAERASTLLTVFQNRRWDSDQLTLARLMAEDRLGTVVRYESRFERWRPSASAESWRDTSAPELGGGQLLDLGSHLVDQALVLFGPVTHVYAEVEALRGAAGDDDAFVALRHAQGAISHLRASAVTAAPGPRLRVLGTKAAFVVRDLDGQEDALRAGARPDRGPEWGAEPEAHWGRLVAGRDSVPVPSEPGDWPRFYALLVRALRDGGPPPVDPHDAVAALGVIEAARRSAASRQVVTLSA